MRSFGHNRVTFVVVISHFLMLLFFVVVGDKNKSEVNRKSIIVNTVIIKNEPLSVKKKKVIKEGVKSKVASQSIAAKKTKDTKIVKSDNHKVKEKEKNEEIPKSLLEKLQNELSALEKKDNSTVKTEGLTVPKISSLEVSQLQAADKNDGKAEFRYKIVDFFKSHLKLPEYGEVKIEIKIKEGAYISEVNVISSESLKNQKYLKDILLKTSIPWLNDYLSAGEEVDLIICFTNEI